MPKHPIQLSDHFTDSRLIRFVLPCIGTMLFTSIYGIVDGLCVSNFVGKTAFAAVNLIMPLPMLIGSVGFMLGTGGSAIVGITLGEGDGKKADELFSLFLSSALAAGIVFSAVGLVILEPVAELLGAKGEMLDYALRYGRILLVSLPTFILQNMFQSFFVTAEKPHLGFAFTVGAGCTNMVLDVVLVGVLRWGVEGAAVATFLSQIVGGLLPVFYFLDRNNTSRLHLSRTKFHGTLYHTFLIFCIVFETFYDYAVSNSQMIRKNQIFAKEDLILKFFSGKEKKLTAESNDELIERLLLENYNRYYHLAYSYVHNPDDASDIVQNGAYLAIKKAGADRAPHRAFFSPRRSRRRCSRREDRAEMDTGSWTNLPFCRRHGRPACRGA